MQQSIETQPTVFVIYGATGDLCWRKLAPALYNLYLDGWMPKMFSIIGAGRKDLTNDAFRERIRDGVNKFSRSGPAEQQTWDVFAKNLSYRAIDVNNHESYATIC